MAEHTRSEHSENNLFLHSAGGGSIATDIDRAISIIESADFEEYLIPLFTGYRVTAPGFKKGLYLYRGRICEKPQNIKEITYPPSEKIKSSGRANNVGESFFYAATARPVPFFELNVKKGHYLALSRWRTTNELLVNHIGFSKEFKEYSGSNRALDDIYSFVKSTKAHSDLNTLVHDLDCTPMTGQIRLGESGGVGH